MKKLLILLMLLGFNQVHALDKFYSPHGTECLMSFSHRVLIHYNDVPDENLIKDKIETQVQHLFGPMSTAAVKAVPKGNHEIKINRLDKINSDTYSASYSYTGTVLISYNNKNTYEIILPLDPDRIYDEARVGSRYPCTDSHYYTQGDFWYFWSPDKNGCKLKENVQYHRIQAQISRIPNTRVTYPEYDLLIQKRNTTEAIVPIHIFVGMDDSRKNLKPDQSDDINAGTFVSLRRDLMQLGFKRNDNLTRLAVDGYLEVLDKNYRDTRAKVVLFFGSTSINSNSTLFHTLFKQSLETSSIIIYDGHSGLGGNLNLDYISYSLNSRITPDPTQYQIYYFNSCSSYPYYNEMYFTPKRNRFDARGTKNLDIVTNGLTTYFSSLSTSSSLLLEIVDLWLDKGIATSWQNYVSQADSDNLMAVNGDEDNPTDPPRR